MLCPKNPRLRRVAGGTPALPGRADPRFATGIWFRLRRVGAWATCRGEGTASAHWLGGGGGGVQDAGHPRAEAFGDALASCRGPAPRLLPTGAGSECRNRGAGHPDASCPDAKWTVRFGMGDVVRDRPSGSDDSRQRGAVSLQTGGVMDQFQRYTRDERSHNGFPWERGRPSGTPASVRVHRSHIPATPWLPEKTRGAEARSLCIEKELIERRA